MRHARTHAPHKGDPEAATTLKLVASTGSINASINTKAAADLDIAVTETGYDSTPTIELAWSLILASMRGIDRETTSLRAGRWQTGLGSNLRGKNLGILGLGNVGSEVARIGLAFGMNVIAWSQNLTDEKASAAGAILVEKSTLFREADVVTVHLVLSRRTRGLIGAPELALMKPTARFINTSRGPIVDEAALIEALQAHRIAGAAIDVSDIEPLQTDHPFRKLENVLATPHIGYVTEDLYRTFTATPQRILHGGFRTTRRGLRWGFDRAVSQFEPEWVLCSQKRDVLGGSNRCRGPPNNGRRHRRSRCSAARAARFIGATD